MNSPYDICQLDYMGALYDRIQLYEQHGFRKLYAGVELKSVEVFASGIPKIGNIGCFGTTKTSVSRTTIFRNLSDSKREKNN